MLYLKFLRMLEKIQSNYNKVNRYIKSSLWMQKFIQFSQSNSYARLMRLNNLIPVFLLILPVWWAIGFVSRNIITLSYYGIIFFVGAILVRGAGCIINDIFDRNIDRHVPRTAERPLATGEISLRNACLFMIILLLGASLILLILPKRIFYIALIALPLIFIYPLMKRITYYPQVFLGLTYNIGVLMAWFTISAEASFMPFLLYSMAALWTVAYDTIYALQDVEYDEKIGMKSTAILYKDKINDTLWKIYQILSTGICIVGLNMHMNILFYFIMAIATYHLYWQTETLEPNNPLVCREIFKSNITFGFIVLISIIIGML